MMDIKSSVYNHILKQDEDFFEKYGSGELI